MSETSQDCFTQGFVDGGIVADDRAPEELPEDAGNDAAGEAESGTAPVMPMGDPGVDPAARKRDLEAFVRTFPNVTPGDVPREVWERARRGESLVTAYMRYESALLRRENEELSRRVRLRETESANRARSAGSQLGSGMGERGRDPFEDGWEDAF